MQGNEATGVERMALQQERLSAFVRRYLAAFGGALTVDLPDYLEVELPSELASELGGRARLELAFTRAALDDHPHAQMMTYGVPLLAAMARSLTDRGDLLRRVLAPRPGRRLDPPAAVNAELEASPTELEWAAHVVVNYRVSYVADGSEEEIVPVVLDATGLPARLIDQLIVSCEHDPSAVAPGLPDGVSADDLPAIDPVQLLAVARRRLPGLVTGRASGIHAAREATLEEGLRRIRLHFDRQRQELAELTSDGARSQLERLPEVLQLRIEEEREKHRVIVKAVPLSLSVTHVPVARRKVAYRRPDGGRREIDVVDTLARDGSIELPCETCKTTLDAVHLCRQGHMSHPGCAVRCVSCAGEHCGACGLAGCTSCGGPTCPACQRSCAVCGRVHCPEHVPVCPACDRPVCAPDRVGCAFCRHDVCRSCVDGSRHCPACRSLAPEDRWDADLRRLAALPEVAAVTGGSSRLASRAHGYLVVTRRGWFSGRVDVFDAAGRLVRSRKAGLLEVLGSRFFP